jgi:uncharacterized protein
MNMPHKDWWYELNTWEPEAALAFYTRALGWEFQTMETNDGAGYWIAWMDGRPVGAIYELTMPEYDGVPAHWMTYLTVADIDRASRDTVREGGEIVRAAVAVPGVGKLAVVTDSTGTLMGLIEHHMEAQARAA